MIDHDHFVGDVGDDAEIMGDQEHRHVELFLQAAQQQQDLCLDGHVECSRRLVGYQQGRPANQRHGDHGALAEAAREFERVHIVGPLRVLETDETQHLLGTLTLLGRGHFGVDAQDFGDLVADGVQRRQGRHRLLEDFADTAAPDGADLLTIARQLQEIDGLARRQRVGKQDAAGGLGRARKNAHDRLAQHRLAGAGLAHQRSHLAGQNAQAGAANRVDRSAHHGEGNPKILDPQEIGPCTHAFVPIGGAPFPTVARPLAGA